MDLIRANMIDAKASANISALDVNNNAVELKQPEQKSKFAVPNQPQSQAEKHGSAFAQNKSAEKHPSTPTSAGLVGVGPASSLQNALTFLNGPNILSNFIHSQPMSMQNSANNMNSVVAQEPAKQNHKLSSLNTSILKLIFHIFDVMVIYTKIIK